MEATTLVLMFATVTSTYHLPQGLLSSICFVETRHQPKALVQDDGGSPSIGICQIKEATARIMGYKGTSIQLRQPKINIKYAGIYLQHQLSRYSGDVVKAVAAYNAGSNRVDKKGLPKNQKYVKKVLLAWRGNQ